MAIPLTGIKAGNVQVPDAAGTLYLHHMAAYFAEVYYAHYKGKETQTLKYPNLPFAVKEFIQGDNGRPDITSFTLNIPRSTTFDADSGASWLKYADPVDTLATMIPGFLIIKA